MDYKDFKKYLQQQVKKALSDNLSSYSAKIRLHREVSFDFPFDVIKEQK